MALQILDSSKCFTHSNFSLVFSRTAEKDMFAWLSSTYRIPPKQEEDNQDDDLLGGQDLPTAMKYRFLKNTAKDHVGVYRLENVLFWCLLCCTFYLYSIQINAHVVISVTRQFFESLCFELKTLLCFELSK